MIQIRAAMKNIAIRKKTFNNLHALRGKLNLKMV
jgi:hypothetical protein